MFQTTRRREDMTQVSRPLSIVHVITSLGIGGAEMMLFRLLSEAQLDQHCVSTVVSFAGGPMVDELRALGIRVVVLSERPRLWSVNLFIRLVRLLNALRPDLIHAWMYHGNLFGGLAGLCVHSTPVIWSIRSEHVSSETDKPITIWVSRISALLSGILARQIVCNSESGMLFHAGVGYARDRMCVVPNGFNLDRFKPDRTAREEIRRELGIDPAGDVIGLVGRFDPTKDHITLIRAARFLQEMHPGVTFVMCGTGVTWETTALSEPIGRIGLQTQFRLLGVRRDVHRIIAALDVLVSCSVTESFSNVLGEAMACGVPCVSTDVGSAVEILGDVGRVVHVGDAFAIAEACRAFLCMSLEDRARLGAAARRRIEEKYSMRKIYETYIRLYEEVVFRTQ